MVSREQPFEKCQADRVTDRLDNDEIRLVLPADAGYSRVARVTAAGIGLRLGLRYRDIEDLRIAVDETLILLLRPEGAAGLVTFLFTIAPDRLIVDAESTAGAGQHWIDQAARSRFEQLVGPVVDDYELDTDEQHVRLVKNRP